MGIALHDPADMVTRIMSSNVILESVSKSELLSSFVSSSLRCALMHLHSANFLEVGERSKSLLVSKTS